MQLKEQPVSKSDIDTLWFGKEQSSQPTQRPAANTEIS